MRPRTHPIWQHATRVCALYEGGKSMPEIGREFGCGYWQVRSVLLDNNIPIRGHGAPMDSGTPEKVNKIMRLRMRGLRWYEIGEKLGMSGPGAFKLAKKYAV